MSYLYALMGMAMLTGIMGMMQMTSNLNKIGLDLCDDSQLNCSEPPEDLYFGSSSQDADRFFLRFLQSLNSNSEFTWHKDNKLCESIRNEAMEFELKNNIERKISESYLLADKPTKSKNNRLIHSCILENSNHRIVISYQDGDTTKPIYNFKYYSCIKETQFPQTKTQFISDNLGVCLFEQNPI